MRAQCYAIGWISHNLSISAAGDRTRQIMSDNEDEMVKAWRLFADKLQAFVEDPNVPEPWKKQLFGDDHLLIYGRLSCPPRCEDEQ